MRLLRLLPRFRHAYRELDLLAAREGWSRAEVEAWQLQRLNAVWEQARAHVPYYRDLAVRLGLPESFASLAEFQAAVPVLPRPEIKARPRDFLSERAAPGAWHVSSGSTGSPTPFYWGHDSHLEALRCRYCMYAAWGVDIFDRTAFLWGDSAAHTPGWAGRLARLRRPVEDWLRNRLRLSAYRLAPAELRQHLRRLARFRPVLLYAYSTAAYLLAREVVHAGDFVFPSLKVCALSAEPAYPHIVEAVESAFGVAAVREYGATECPLIAGEGPDRTLRVREDFVFVETRPAADGRHEILLTVLGNPSFPLLRYAVGDRTDGPVQVPARGFAVLKNVAGRENELLVSRSGCLLHPLRFDMLFGFGWAEAVRRYRVHQQADGAVTVAVEVRQPVPPRDVARMEQELENLLEGFPVKLEIVRALPPTAGKHRWTTSDLVPQSRNSGVAPAARYDCRVL
jgi:phenylacetate-CoA ligase